MTSPGEVDQPGQRYGLFKTHTMNTSFKERFAQIGNDIKQIRTRLTNVEQSGGGSGDGDTTPSGKWQQTDHYGPEEPTGSYHRSPVGLVIDPHEPIRLDAATIDADSSGTLNIQIYQQTDSGGVGYKSNPFTELNFDVSEGVQTIEFDNLVLEPLPDSYTGYCFSIDKSDVQLRRISDADIPMDIGIASLRDGNASTGSTYGSYYHFFNLKISSGRPDSPFRRATNAINSGSAYDLTAERFNDTHYIHDTSGDIGAKIQQFHDQAKDGDVLRIAPGEYTATSTAELTRDIHIVSDGKPQNGRTRTWPVKINLVKDDTPVLHVQDGRPTFEGLGFYSPSGVTSHAIYLNSRARIENCAANNFNDDVYYFHQRGSDDNLNHSHTRSLYGQTIKADLVKLENTSGEAHDLNACFFHIAQYGGGGSTGYAINSEDGFGNRYDVDYCEGAGDIKGAVRANGNEHVIEVGYLEAVQHAIVFDDGANRCYGEIGYIYGSEGDPIVWGDGFGNRVETRARSDIRNGAKLEFEPGSPTRRSQSIDGSDMIYLEPGRGPLVRDDDGTGYRLVVGDDEEPTFERLDSLDFEW